MVTNVDRYQNPPNATARTIITAHSGHPRIESISPSCQPIAAIARNDRKPPAGPGGPAGGFRRGGRYWDRTSDLFRVREARYRCANRPDSLSEPGFAQDLEGVAGGGDGIRTRVDGFAGRCLASRPPHHRGSRLREYPNGGIPSGESQGFEKPHTRADDEIRTRDPHLGKVMRYHCATSALVFPLSRRRRKLYTNPGASTKILPVHRACPPSSCGSGRFEPPRTAQSLPCGARLRAPCLLSAPHHAVKLAPRRQGRTVRTRPNAARCAAAHAQRATPGERVVFEAPPDIRYYRLARTVQGAIGAVGSALRSHRRGHQFESGIAHP